MGKPYSKQDPEPIQTLDSIVYLKAFSYKAGIPFMGYCAVDENTNKLICNREMNGAQQFHRIYDRDKNEHQFIVWNNAPLTSMNKYSEVSYTKEVDHVGKYLSISKPSSNGDITLADKSGKNTIFKYQRPSNDPYFFSNNIDSDFSKNSCKICDEATNVVSCGVACKEFEVDERNIFSKLV